MQYTEEIARTTKDPKILVEILKRNNDDDVSKSAAINPSCPPEMLVEILKRNIDNFVSRYAAYNRSCPREILDAANQET